MTHRLDPIPGQSGPGSDGNEGVLRIPQSSQHYWSITIRLFNIIFMTLIKEVLPLCRDVVGVFCCRPQPTWPLKCHTKVKESSLPYYFTHSWIGLTIIMSRCQARISLTLSRHPSLSSIGIYIYIYNGFTYFHLIQIILFTINHWFPHR